MDADTLTPKDPPPEAGVADSLGPTSDADADVSQPASSPLEHGQSVRKASQKRKPDKEQASTVANGEAEEQKSLLQHVKQFRDDIRQKRLPPEPGELLSKYRNVTRPAWTQRSKVSQELAVEMHKCLGDMRIIVGDIKEFRDLLNETWQLVREKYEKVNRVTSDSHAPVEHPPRYLRASLDPDEFFSMAQPAELIKAIIHGRLDIPQSAADWLSAWLRATAAPQADPRLREAAKPLAAIVADQELVIRELRQRNHSEQIPTPGLPEEWAALLGTHEHETEKPVLSQGIARTESSSIIRKESLPTASEETPPASPTPVVKKPLVQPGEAYGAGAALYKGATPVTEKPPVQLGHAHERDITVMAEALRRESDALSSLLVLASRVTRAEEPRARIESWLSTASGESHVARVCKDLLLGILRHLSAKDAQLTQLQREAQRLRTVQADLRTELERQRIEAERRLVDKERQHTLQLTAKDEQRKALESDLAAAHHKLERFEGDLQRATAKIKELEGREENIYRPRIIAELIRVCQRDINALAQYAARWKGSNNEAESRVAKPIASFLNALGSAGITQIGIPGEQYPFDPEIHEAVVGSLDRGQLVRVAEPGWSVRAGDSTQVVQKAQVGVIESED